MIEWRYGLPSLTPRDAAANNLAEVLNLGAPPQSSAPRWTVNPVPALPCAVAGTG
jgi:phospholipase C